MRSRNSHVDNDNEEEDQDEPELLDHHDSGGFE